jgi:transcriptional regulator GlxA family with amidase domain
MNYRNAPLITANAVFAARFAAQAGGTPVAPLRGWGMLRAADLLVTSRLPLAEIAEVSSHGSKATCATAFRKMMGTSPRR